MGSLTLPESGSIYVDTNCVIYSVEKIEPYCSELGPVWHAAQNGSIQIVCSELVLVEALVKPVREKDKVSEALYREFLTGSGEVELLPVTRGVLERAIDIRAHHRLSTPDAIHAATALEAGCVAFLTNDAALAGIPGLAVLGLNVHR